MDQLLVDPKEYTCNLKLPPANSLRIYDSTLRDGEQMPGVAFSPETKLSIALELSRIGCHTLEVGFPAVSEGERKALGLILRARRAGAIRPDVEIVVMCRSRQDDILQAIRAIRCSGFEPSEVTFLLFTSASRLHCKYKLGLTLLRYGGIPEQEFSEVPVTVFQKLNCRLVSDAISFALSCGVQKIDFGAEDASRTPIGELLDLIQAAADAGASRYVFADTTGCLTPEGTAKYCASIAEAFPQLQLASHFHNDFGLAVANVLTSIRYGFTVVSTTANGIGERAGNAAMHSVVVALRVLYGLEIPTFRYELLNHLRSVIEQFSGVPVQCHEPVIGYNAFAHESGVHVHGIQVDRSLYEAISYESVGGSVRNVYGKHSGVAGILKVLEDNQHALPTPVTRKLAEQVLSDVKLLREQKSRSGGGKEWVNSYYTHLEHLGLTEQEVVRCAVRRATRTESI